MVVENSSNVVIKGKKITNHSKLEAITIDAKAGLENENLIANAHSKKSKSLAHTKRLASFELVEKPNEKIFGSIEIKKIYEEISDSNSSTSGFLPQEIFQVSFTLNDNYLIPNDNNLLITKERIVSSQNLHGTLFVKALLDPPKKMLLITI